MTQISISPSPARAIAVFLAAVVLVAAACNGGGSTNPGTPSRLTITGGDSETLMVGGRASAPLVVKVANAQGSGLPNVTVTWAIDSARGAVSPLTSTSDANGEARTTYYSASTAGPVHVVGSAGSGSAKFVLELRADTLGALAGIGGNGAAVVVGFPVTLTARASDRFGNPIAGVVVDWTASGGILQKSTSTTDTTGKASTGLVPGPDAGAYTVHATSRLGDASFTVNAVPAS